MIIPVENKCLQCKRVFCCPQCRIKHEQKEHLNSISVGNEKTSLENPKIIQPSSSCVLCRGQPFTLQKKHSHELLKHLADQHLPLRCNKCLKVFTSSADFLAITACKLEARGSCDLRSHRPTTQIALSDKCLATTEDNKSIASTAAYTNDSKPAEVDTNPMNQSNISQQITPVAQYNMSWNSKVGRGLLTDSISSIRNASSLMNNTSSANTQPNLHKTQSPKAKLVRQTSTPMQRCFSVDSGSATNGHQGLPDQKRSSFDSINSSGQMSSIYTPNHTSVSDSSPSESASRASPTKPKTSRLRKKMPVAATPLRQVMSRSIQKAMVQHGLPSKFISSRIPYNPSVIWSPASRPLDLRTSPVIRRTVSFSSVDFSLSSIASEKVQHDSKQYDEYSKDPVHPVPSTNSSTSTASDPQYQLVVSVYESCESIDVLEAESHQLNPMSTTAALPISSAVDHQTPKTSGVLIKANSFAERRAAPRPSFYNEDFEKEACISASENAQCGDDSAAFPESTTTHEESIEQWFTPCAKIRQSPSSLAGSNRKPVAFNLNDVDNNGTAQVEDALEKTRQFSTTSDLSDNENVFYENTKTPTQSEQPASGGLWSLVTSVIRMASFGQDPPKSGLSLLKRCASFAGRITTFERDVVADDDGGIVTTTHEAPTNKRRRTKTSGSQAEQSPTIGVKNKIIGRPPLKRMRRVLREPQ